jgi:hypothetical protein
MQRRIAELMSLERVLSNAEFFSKMNKAKSWHERILGNPKGVVDLDGLLRRGNLKRSRAAIHLTHRYNLYQRMRPGRQTAAVLRPSYSYRSFS